MRRAENGRQICHMGCLAYAQMETIPSNKPLTVLEFTVHFPAI